MPDPQKAQGHLKAFVLYIAFISVIYAPVVFGGKTLLPTVIQPHGLADGAPHGYTGRVPVNTFNADYATPSYYELPVNRTVGRIYSSGEIPLWNPHQAGGTPLAADYSTRAFFPYQVLEDLSPAGLWDYFILGRMLAAGFFTYLFLSLLGLSLPAAFTGGLFYMFSGVFTWFAPLEQFTNVGMCAPLVMYLGELLARRRGLAEATLLGLGFSQLMLAGQPEAALYVFLLSGAYLAWRGASLCGKDLTELLNVYGKTIIGLVTGLLIAAPLILPFLDYVSISHNLHAPGQGVGLEYAHNWKKVFTLLFPSTTVVPADPSILPEALARTTGPGGTDHFYRVFATKGAWDYLGGYIGMLPVFLTLMGLVLVTKAARLRSFGPLLFFLFFGLFILLKNFGVKPFQLLGALPLFDQAWSPRWSGPSWVFAFSASGALGLQALIDSTGIFDRGDIPGGWAARGPLLAFALILAALLAVPLPAAFSLVSNSSELFAAGVTPYVWPSIGLGHVTGVVVLVSALVLALTSLKRASAFWAVMVLAVLELWWNVPRGYDATWISMKSLPFVIGLVSVFLISDRRSLKGGVIAFLIFFISFLWMDSSAPRGLASRHDPFREPPYVEFLKKRMDEDRPRVVGTHGVLMPNYAGAAGLDDLRYVNALLLPSFRDYRYGRLEEEVPGGERASSALWFTGMPQRIVVDFKEEAGYHYRITERAPEDDIIENLPGYSFLGVRYVLAPGGLELPDAEGRLKLVYDKELRVYENTGALPRAFLVVPFRDREAFNRAAAGAEAGKTRGLSIGDDVLEERAGGAGPFEKARITVYRANRVTVESDSEKPGVLVLTDVLAPGWEARVDGSPAEIIPVNGLVRGVLVDSGPHVVEFSYSPPGFRKGLWLLAAGLVFTAATNVRQRCLRQSTGLKSSGYLQ